jgi:(R,R)-butanediol dehydrogenase/meso-butanediol dehydrogenase/diacetyl reductase
MQPSGERETHRVPGLSQLLAEHWERFARLISHRVPVAEVERAFRLALTPGAAEKVIVTFD